MRSYLILLLFIGLTVMSCKSEFEKVRTSSDPKLIYKEALKLYEEEDYVRAQTLFELAIPFYRGKSEAEELFYKYANTYYELKEYILASHYFDNFTKTFYNSDKKEEAAYLGAYGYYKMSPSFRLDQTYSEKAVANFQKFVNTYPNSPRVEQCNKLIDEIRDKNEKKAFYNAELYYDLKRYKSAIQSFENLIKDYPNSKNDERIKFLLIESNYLLAENSIFELKEKRYSKTIDYYNKFIQKYPKSSYLKKANKMNKNSQTTIKKLEKQTKIASK